MALVAVVGPSAPDAEPTDLEEACDLGRRLAEHGFAVLTGGLDGVMASAAQGVRQARGVVVGLLPGTDAREGNEFLTVAVPTGIGQARNGLLVAAADAVVAVGCSWGTLSEIALARRLGKPLACLRPWRLLDQNGQEVPLPLVSTPAEAVRTISKRLAG